MTAKKKTVEDLGREFIERHRRMRGRIEVIRQRCTDCLGHQVKEVTRCDGLTREGPSPLHPYRFAKNPAPDYDGPAKKLGAKRAMMKYCT